MESYKRCVEHNCCLLRDHDRMMCCYYCEKNKVCVAAGCLKNCKNIPKPPADADQIDDDE